MLAFSHVAATQGHGTHSQAVLMPQARRDVAVKLSATIDTSILPDGWKDDEDKALSRINRCMLSSGLLNNLHVESVRRKVRRRKTHFQCNSFCKALPLSHPAPPHTGAHTNLPSHRCTAPVPLSRPLLCKILCSTTHRCLHLAWPQPFSADVFRPSTCTGRAVPPQQGLP